MFKAIVMEIKEKYVIVMKDGGEILRINKKSDLKIGETIFWTFSSYSILSLPKKEKPTKMEFPLPK